MINRRIFAACMGGWFLTACTAQNPKLPSPTTASPKLLTADPNEPFPVDPVDLAEIDSRFWRQIVDDPTGEPAGTLVVDPEAKFLWLVLETGKALRYGVGVGRDGFSWHGIAVVARKARWPRWTPPWASGMPGGPENPLGARALYLYRDGKDTLYRIHGTSEADSIGQSVSSGCIRLLNAEVIDLYRRVPVGTRVVVRQAASAIG
jgi:lipoprotein-anchoring transpeptidase ErfK/SrfK